MSGSDFYGSNKALHNFITINDGDAYGFTTFIVRFSCLLFYFILVLQSLLQ